MARQSVSPQITASILEYVKANEMRAGQHLPCQMLADAFRVSRAPVNAALKKLEEMGIVSAEPNRGYFLRVDAANVDTAEPTAPAQGEEDDALYFRLAEDRLAGRLEERVSENELMRLYDVPRSRLLKVLHRIAEEGWVERLPGNGWAFRETLTSRKSYEEGYVFRAVIEQQAMLLPSFRPDEEKFRKARAVQTALANGGYESWSRADIFKANNEFHEMLVACSQNEFFLDSIRRINRLRRLIEYHVTMERSRLPQQTSEHLHILDLIEAGRRTEAAAFLYTHIMGAGRIKAPLV
ncbi:GntR family transcriptional regulator [Phyllobacterium salinisoli]|uniref:GntR family transcriptional regulator n=1 Tax=Phyllobacterium salinisoli TaxID=1899321 RepID=A0A368K117_9HYPH|nr:GntR family transcriptional regulator [Phyllobacterium salinisoli]RCS22092.1 GntR family transcriptional regulator [Phyllobacterium salinisoli]